MRKIKILSIFVASLIIISSWIMTFALAWGAHLLLPSWEYRSVMVFAVWIAVFFWISLGTYRFASTFFPIAAGSIAPGSKEEFNYEVVTIVQLMTWSWFYRAQPWPVPMSAIVFRILGAQIGQNSYTGGLILDPWFVTLGDNCLLGYQSMICPHGLEGSKIEHQPIRIGNNVTIGAFAIVLPGCEIGDGAVLGMNSVLSKNSKVPPGEVWAGAPARKIK